MKNIFGLKPRINDLEAFLNETFQENNSRGLSKEEWNAHVIIARLLTNIGSEVTAETTRSGQTLKFTAHNGASVTVDLKKDDAVISFTPTALSLFNTGTSTKPKAKTLKNNQALDEALNLTEALVKGSETSQDEPDLEAEPYDAHDYEAYSYRDALISLAANNKLDPFKLLANILLGSSYQGLDHNQEEEDDLTTTHTFTNRTNGYKLIVFNDGTASVQTGSEENFATPPVKDGKFCKPIERFLEGVSFTLGIEEQSATTPLEEFKNRLKSGQIENHRRQYDLLDLEGSPGQPAAASAVFTTKETIAQTNKALFSEFLKGSNGQQSELQRTLQQAEKSGLIKPGDLSLTNYPTYIDLKLADITLTVFKESGLVHLYKNSELHLDPQPHYEPDDDLIYSQLSFSKNGNQLISLSHQRPLPPSSASTQPPVNTSRMHLQSGTSEAVPTGDMLGQTSPLLSPSRQATAYATSGADMFSSVVDESTAALVSTYSSKGQTPRQSTSSSASQQPSSPPSPPLDHSASSSSGNRGQSFFQDGSMSVDFPAEGLLSSPQSSSQAKSSAAVAQPYPRRREGALLGAALSTEQPHDGHTVYHQGEEELPLPLNRSQQTLQQSHVDETPTSQSQSQDYGQQHLSPTSRRSTAAHSGHGFREFGHTITYSGSQRHPLLQETDSLSVDSLEGPPLYSSSQAQDGSPFTPAAQTHQLRRGIGLQRGRALYQQPPLAETATMFQDQSQDGSTVAHQRQLPPPPPSSSSRRPLSRYTSSAAAAAAANSARYQESEEGYPQQEDAQMRVYNQYGAADHPSYTPAQAYIDPNAFTENYEVVTLTEYEIKSGKARPSPNPEALQSTHLASDLTAFYTPVHILTSKSYKEVDRLDGQWKAPDRANNRKVLGEYQSNEEVDRTLYNVIILVASTLNLPNQDNPTLQDKLKAAVEAIKLAKQEGGITNKAIDHLQEVSPEENAWNKLFSKNFQEECKRCGILSGRNGSKVGLRTAYVPESVINLIKQPISHDTVQVSKQDLDLRKIQAIAKVKAGGVNYVEGMMA